MIVVTATDPAGLTATATATINLIDVNENATVDIDIKPGDASNTINIKSHGKIEVAILSTATFDARTVDLESLRFGRTGTEDSVSRMPQGTIRYRLDDINGDGRLDVVVPFEIERLGFRVGDTVGILKGRTRGGLLFEAQDLVTIKDPGK